MQLGRFDHSSIKYYAPLHLIQKSFKCKVLCQGLLKINLHTNSQRIRVTSLVICQQTWNSGNQLKQGSGTANSKPLWKNEWQKFLEHFDYWSHGRSPRTRKSIIWKELVLFISGGGNNYHRLYLTCTVFSLRRGKEVLGIPWRLSYTFIEFEAMVWNNAKVWAQTRFVVFSWPNSMFLTYTWIYYEVNGIRY